MMRYRVQRWNGLDWVTLVDEEWTTVRAWYPTRDVSKPGDHTTHHKMTGALVVKLTKSARGKASK